MPRSNFAMTSFSYSAYLPTSTTIRKTVSLRAPAAHQSLNRVFHLYHSCLSKKGVAGWRSSVRRQTRNTREHENATLRLPMVWRTLGSADTSTARHRFDVRVYSSIFDHARACALRLRCTATVSNCLLSQHFRPGISIATFDALTLCSTTHE